MLILLSELSSEWSIFRQTGWNHSVWSTPTTCLSFSPLLPSRSVSLPLTIYEAETSGQSELTAKCSRTLRLPSLFCLHSNRRPESSTPALCWTPSIIHRSSRLWQEMHGHISSLLALSLLSHSEHTQHTQIHASLLSRPHSHTHKA